MAASAQNNKRAASSDTVETETERPAKVMKFDFLNTVKIVVGHRIEFAVPKNLMIQRSRVFAKRNSEGWIDKPFNLISHRKEDVPRYLQLLYSGQLVLFPEEEKTTAEQKWEAIVDLETLTSVVFQDVVSENLISDEFVRMLHQGLSYRAALQAFGNYQVKTLRQILLDFVVEKLEAGDVPPELYQFEKGVAVLHEAVTELSKRKQSGEQWPRQNTKEGMKRYHKSVE